MEKRDAIKLLIIAAKKLEEGGNMSSDYEVDFHLSKELSELSKEIMRLVLADEDGCDVYIEMVKESLDD